LGGFMKKGFGLLEVLVAALVLGFLVVGLNRLQLGNREGVLRVRARDAANFVAQHVLDSLGSLGINSIEEKTQAKCDGNTLVYCEPRYRYSFDNTKTGLSAPIDYRVEVELLHGAGTEQKRTDDTTYFDNTEGDTYAKSLEATVSWKFKNSTQSITMAKVVR